MRCLAFFILLAVTAEIVGCGGAAETDEQRLKRLVPNAAATTKVTGKVLVDGKPIKSLWVTLHPNDSSVTLRPTGQTDAEGNFQISTYSGGDGAPKGEWNITIEWLKYIKRDAEWGGPDQLKNLYNDPKTTEFHVTVGDTPIELPPFELKVEGVAAKPAPAKPTAREERGAAPRKRD